MRPNSSSESSGHACRADAWSARPADALAEDTVLMAFLDFLDRDVIERGKCPTAAPCSRGMDALSPPRPAEGHQRTRSTVMSLSLDEGGRGLGH